MIFFCEDCGNKNDLGKASIQGGRVVFRCHTCQYLNSYPVPSDPEKIEDILKKIQLYPEIIGTFLYHGKNLTITNNMPQILTKADLKVLVNYLTRCCTTAQSYYPDIHEVTITISDKHITIKRIEPDLFIFIVSKTLPLPEKIQKILMSAEKSGEK